MSLRDDLVNALCRYEYEAKEVGQRKVIKLDRRGVEQVVDGVIGLQVDPQAQPLCENCGKPMADHDAMAHCWPRGSQVDPPPAMTPEKFRAAASWVECSPFKVVVRHRRGRGLRGRPHRVVEKRG